METTNDRRKRRLKFLADKHSLLSVAAKAGVSYPGLDQVLKGTLLPPKADGTRSARSLGDRTANAIEDAYELGRGWFDLPGNEGLDADPGLMAKNGWNRRAESLYQSFEAHGVPFHEAHALSELGARVPPKRLRVEWRAKLNEDDLPTQFEVRMPDDALAGMIDRGEWVICSRTATPRIGKGVLVIDQAGTPYIRKYEEGAAGKWFAVATMPGRRDLEGDVEVRRVAAVLGSYFEEEDTGDSNDE